MAGTDNPVFLEDPGVYLRPGVYSVVVLEESPCPRGSSKANFQVLVLGHQVLVLVLEASLLVLVLVLESQVLDNNTACLLPTSALRIRGFNVHEGLSSNNGVMHNNCLFIGIFLRSVDMHARRWLCGLTLLSVHSGRVTFASSAR